MSDITVVWQVLFALLLFLGSVHGQVSYSIPEEMSKGSLVGNIAQDLGLDLKRLKSGKARIYSEDNTEYIELNKDRGVLLIKERIDRETLCGQRTPCALHFQIVLENPMELYSVVILIQDQNDNAPQILYPVQTSGSLVTEIVPRSADVGYLVTKVVAVDVDSGQNAWLSYKIQKVTDRALFEVGAQNGEIRTIRQVTDKDTVKQKLTVIVEDNGQPSRSATVNVNVALADSFPEVLSEFSDFTHKEYNDNLTFYLVLALAVVSFLFIVSIIAILSVKCYRWRRDRMVYKSNGNLPVIPYYPPLYADVGGTGTLQHVYNYEHYRTTDSRKSDMKYARPCNQSIISLDNTEIQTLPHAHNEKLIDDTDDQVSYSIPEEIPKGSFVGNIAQDLGLDLKRLNRGKARIHTGDDTEYIALNKDRGILSIKERIDRETLCGQTTPCALHFQIMLEDPLEFYTVTIIIQDQNDNAPQVLYPVHTGSSVVAEIVPRSADVGYLVTKVVAVDVDSGQNAWLSYKLQKNMERALFEVGAQNGEIRIIRQITDKDAVKQKLTVVVEDNGQPPRSATVNVNVALADSFPEVLSEFSDFTHDKEYNDNLTFYLVLALAVVSFLFIVSIIAIFSVKCYRWRRERMFYKSNGHLPVIPYYPPLYADAGNTGTLQHVYNYEVCRTTDSRKSDLKHMRPCSQSIISLNTNGTLTLPHAHRDKLIFEDSDDQVSSS
ncbi:protocadherin beta-16-like [Sardina pilchardus]|uniref:protocadherin beta-16-like n=1 Tax=Sardina pilchardus TaxID=27697 RepID=UPI002E148641